MKEKEKPDRSDEEDFEGSTGMVYNGPFFPRMKDTSKKSDNQLFFEGRLKGLLNQVILAENSLPKKETKASATQKKLDLARADLKSARADLTSLEGQLEVVESNFDDVMSILRDIDSTGSNTIDEELLERVKEMVADFPEEEVGGEGGEEEEDEDEEEEEDEDNEEDEDEDEDEDREEDKGNKGRQEIANGKRKATASKAKSEAKEEAEAEAQHATEAHDAAGGASATGLACNELAISDDAWEKLDGMRNSIFGGQRNPTPISLQQARLVKRFMSMMVHSTAPFHLPPPAPNTLTTTNLFRLNQDKRPPLTPKPLPFIK